MYTTWTEDDGGIPRSDFEQDGYHYLTDLLEAELPANESQHTETVSVNSRTRTWAVLNPATANKGVITEG